MKETLCNAKASCIGLGPTCDYKEPSTLERLIEERNQVQNHLTRLNEAIEYINNNPEADKTFRKLRSLGAH